MRYRLIIYGSVVGFHALMLANCFYNPFSVGPEPACLIDIPAFRALSEFYWTLLFSAIVGFIPLIIYLFLLFCSCEFIIFLLRFLFGKPEPSRNAAIMNSLSKKEPELEGEIKVTVVSEENGKTITYIGTLEQVGESLFRFRVEATMPEGITNTVTEKNTLQEMAAYMRAETKFVLEDFKIYL